MMRSELAREEVEVTGSRVPLRGTGPGPAWKDEPVISARFDDDVHDRHLAFPAGQEVRADELAEVLPALARIEAAVAAGAWAHGFIAYEAAPAFDPVLAVHPPREGLPLLRFELTDGPVAEATDGTVAEPADGLVAEAEERASAGAAAGLAPLEWAPDIDAAEHARLVGLVHAAIARGDTYQVNLTARLRAAFDGDASALYAALRARQRGAFSAYVDAGRHAIVSASPECFFTWDDGILMSRPMKGTARRRPEDPLADAAARETLRGSAKEQAENVMIVDLLRNDMQRVAEPGGLDVPALLTVEEYPTVWTMTSTIRTRTQPDASLTDVLSALFPCGSVTGAPKASTMGLIRELESAPRGVYCGAIGCIAPSGRGSGHGPRASFSVPIRTAEIDHERGEAVYGVGGGITWHSEAGAEWDELLAKARILEEL